jgi:hypothetical protein
MWGHIWLHSMGPPALRRFFAGLAQGFMLFMLWGYFMLTEVGYWHPGATSNGLKRVCITHSLRALETRATLYHVKRLGAR